MNDAAAPITIAASDGVQTIRFNRAEKKNALTDAMYHAIADAMERAEADPAIGAHLFLGSNGVFTAGNDIGDFLAQVTGPETPGERGVTRFLTLQCMAEKPMVAGVDGLAIGIGTTLLLQCDMVLATPRALFRTPFIDLGAVPENASSLLGPQVMGHPRAFELLCLGEAFPAERALSAGLVNAIVAVEDLETAAQALAARIAAKPREAMRLSRALLRGNPQDRLAASQREMAIFAERIRSAEARAAFEAFLSRKQG